jgi:uncharacterized protein YdaU (DUF1376 family)
MASIGDNGGPAFDIDTDDIKMSWIKLDIAAFKRGIVDLDYEMRGFYITLLVEMYDSKGKLPNDLYLLGKRLGTTARVVRRVLDVLIEQDKIYVSGDWLRNKRCDEEREKLIAEYCRRHAAAVKREATRRQNADANPEVSAKFPESLAEVSLKQSQNRAEFGESLDQTIGNSPTKTKDEQPELWVSSDQNCAHNLEKKKKEDRNKEREVPPNPQGGSINPKPISGKAIARIAFGEWQEFARLHSLPVPKDTTFETFATAILARMREHAEEPTQRGMLAVWHLALCYVAKSRWLRGLSGDFKAELAMITRPKNFAKLISGGYLNGAAPVDSRWSMSSTPGSSDSKAEASTQRIIEENEAFAAAQGWFIPNQGVTRE